MKRISLTTLAVMVAVVSSACIVAPVRPGAHCVLGVSATSYYGFGTDKAYHFDKANLGVEGYVGIETKMKHAIFTLNGGASIDRTKWNIGADCFIDPFGRNIDYGVLPKIVVGGGYRNINGSDIGYMEAGLQLCFGRRESPINFIIDSRVGNNNFVGGGWYNINRIGVRVIIP